MVCAYITDRPLDIAEIRRCIVFFHKGQPFLVFGRALPLWIGRISGEGSRDDANAFLEHEQTGGSVEALNLWGFISAGVFVIH
jgi:hypothetical protein